MAKLLAMEDRLHQRVVGQHEAVEAVSNALRRSRAGLPTPTGRSARSCSSAPPASARPSSPARSPSTCSTRRTRWCASTCPSTWRSTPWPGSSARPRLRRLRGGRPAHRGGAPAPVQRDPARRDREGPRRRLQHPPAGDGRRPPHRRPGPHGRLPQRRADHDVEHPGRTQRRRGDVQAEFINRLDDIIEFDSLTEEQLRTSSTSRSPGSSPGRRAGRGRRAHRRRPRPPRQARLRPGVRGAPAQAGDPAPPRRPARARAAAGRVLGRRPRPRWTPPAASSPSRSPSRLRRRWPEHDDRDADEDAFRRARGWSAAAGRPGASRSASSAARSGSGGGGPRRPRKGCRSAARSRTVFRYLPFEEVVRPDRALRGEAAAAEADAPPRLGLGRTWSASAVVREPSETVLSGSPRSAAVSVNGPSPRSR